MSNGKIKYNADSKTWECTICNKTSSKYNRKQIINHVNTAHIANKSSLRNRTVRGTHVEKENDRILQMEHDYGRITTEIEYDETSGRRKRLLKCTRCIYKPFARETKAGVKRHLSWHNETGKAYNLDCPYCPSNFSTLGELNIHIYNKICPERKHTIELKTWPEIWKDICEKNKEEYQYPQND